MAIFSILKGFSIFNFLKNNILYIIIGIALIGVIYGYWKYQENVVLSLVKKIDEKEDQIKKLESEKNTLQFNLDILNMSNENLKYEIERKEKEYKNSVESLKRIRKILEESNKRIKILENRIRDSNRRNDFKNLKEKEKALEMLKRENEFLNCYVENFSNINIDCIK